MYRSLFARDAFAQLDRLQRELQEAFDLSPSIRGIGRGGFPALNVGGTPQAVEVYAFAPGLDPATMPASGLRIFHRGTMIKPPCTSTSGSAAGSGGC
jgi:hypothetical protein